MRTILIGGNTTAASGTRTAASSLVEGTYMRGEWWDQTATDWNGIRKPQKE